MEQLLKRAREGMEALARDYRAWTGLDGAHDDGVTRATAVLKEIDSHLALSDYDRAVEAIAPYLPDGWVAQDKDCTLTTLFKLKPGMNEWSWTCVDSEFEFSLDPMNIPAATDWRTSLREIRGGAVV